jgi:hypothetical protein
MSTSLTCRMCGVHHIYGQPCDQKTQRERLMDAFNVGPAVQDLADRAATIDLVRWNIKRGRPA